MDDDKCLVALLGRAEHNSILSLALHEMAEREGRGDWARILWVMHLNASDNADQIQEVMGLTE